MACAYEEYSSSFPTTGGSLRIFPDDNWLDTPFYAIKIYFDNENSYFSCL